MGDPFTGGSHEKWDHPWSSLCVACKGYPQEHTRDEHCLVGPSSLEIGGTVIQFQDIRLQTSDPGCEED